jgi:hypothetical protein
MLAINTLPKLYVELRVKDSEATAVEPTKTGSILGRPTDQVTSAISLCIIPRRKQEAAPVADFF